MIDAPNDTLKNARSDDRTQKNVLFLIKEPLKYLFWPFCPFSTFFDFFRLFRLFSTFFDLFTIVRKTAFTFFTTSTPAGLVGRRPTHWNVFVLSIISCLASWYGMRYWYVPWAIAAVISLTIIINWLAYCRDGVVWHEVHDNNMECTIPTFPLPIYGSHWVYYSSPIWQIMLQYGLPNCSAPISTRLVRGIAYAMFLMDHLDFKFGGCSRLIDTWLYMH